LLGSEFDVEMLATLGALAAESSALGVWEAEREGLIRDEQPEDKLKDFGLS
jgi:predicted ATPase